MITRFYADVLANGDISRICHIDDPDEGPPQVPDTEGTAHYIGTSFTWDAPSETCKPVWVGGAVTWVETLALADHIAAAIGRTYLDIDAVVEDAVGRRDEEYKAAEAEARTFAAAGYAEPAPRSVAKFAQKNPTMQVQSNQWAADQVIARADALAAAKADMRDQRFDSQWDMRAATTDAELEVAIASWHEFIDNTRAQLGLPAIKR